MTAEQALNRALEFAANDSYDTVEAMKKRRDLFPAERQAVLAGAAMNPQARQLVDNAIQDAWRSGEDTPTLPGEIIIGSGPHAAIYAAVSVQRGKRKPLVLEASARPGGTFAMTRGPAFALNSRNWPGTPGLPAEQGNVNFFPGAPVQLAQCCVEPFPSNDMVAFLTRVMLARYAIVVPGTVVTETGPDYVIGREGERFTGTRTIDARGLGGEADTGIDRVVTFTGLMERIDQETFPFRGIRRVAVIGDGDSGRCAVESLLGIAPARHLSAAGIDFIDRIDWYGTRLFGRNPSRATRFAWRTGERGRYQELGSYLPRELGQPTRVRPFGDRGEIAPGMGFASVNNRQYDLVVRCTGQTQPPDIGDAAYRIGAIGAPPFSTQEQRTPAARRPESRVAFFRLAPLTARLAMTLD